MLRFHIQQSSSLNNYAASLWKQKGKKYQICPNFSFHMLVALLMSVSRATFFPFLMTAQIVKLKMHSDQNQCSQIAS